MSDRVIYNATGRPVTLNIQVGTVPVSVQVDPFFKTGGGRPVNQKEFEALKNNKFFTYLESNKLFTVNKIPGVLIPKGTGGTPMRPARLDGNKRKNKIGQKSGFKMDHTIKPAGAVSADSGDPEAASGEK